MTIQFNTDKTISGAERQDDFFSARISDELEQFASHISRIEVHLSDENEKKNGIKDIRCLIEARIEGRQPIVASNQAATIELAVSGAIDKLKAALKTVIGRSQNH